MEELMRKLFLPFICLLVLGILIFSCEDPDSSDWESPTAPPTISPGVIDSLVPAELFLKETVTIYGMNFNPDPEKNAVVFGNKLGVVLTASETMLEVETPIYSDETVNVKMTVEGSVTFSNEESVYFKPALSILDEETVWPKGVAVDANENVYFASGEDEIIYKLTPDGEKSEFVSFPVNGSMQFGPEGYLYVCTGAGWWYEEGDGKIARISPDGATIEDVVMVGWPTDFDWDANGDMYISTNWNGIWKYDTGGTLSQVNDELRGIACRIFGNHLYVSTSWDGLIHSFEITGSGLDNEEIIYEDYDYIPMGIEVDKNGTVYIAQFDLEAILAIKTDGSEESIFPGQITNARYMTFHGKSMYWAFAGWGDVGIIGRAYIGIEQGPSFGQ
jgi:hypothetical protein